MEERQGQILGKVMTFLLLVSMLLVVKESAAYVNVLTQKEIVQTQKTIVIDPGHGGNDPGKVGINQALEKDVNLEIALKLKKYLEQQDIHVVMTRQEDKGLYEETDKEGRVKMGKLDTNKKVKDMKQRLSIMEQSKPALVVSVHQNSYPEESISGVQVFYYRDSLEGKKAAQLMQEQMIETLQPVKKREAKENSTYYILKKTTVPTIIVECGFLSNSTEAGLLVTPEYQEKVAWAIHMGIMRYLNAET